MFAALSTALNPRTLAAASTMEFDTLAPVRNTSEHGAPSLADQSRPFALDGEVPKGEAPRGPSGSEEAPTESRGAAYVSQPVEEAARGGDSGAESCAQCPTRPEDFSRVNECGVPAPSCPKYPGQARRRAV